MEGKHPGKKIIEAHGLVCVSKKHFTTEAGDRFALRTVAYDPYEPETVERTIRALKAAQFVVREDDQGTQILIGPSFEVIKFAPSDNVHSHFFNRSFHRSVARRDEMQSSHDVGTAESYCQQDVAAAQNPILDIVSRLTGRAGQDTTPNEQPTESKAEMLRRRMKTVREQAKPCGSGCLDRMAEPLDCIKAKKRKEGLEDGMDSDQENTSDNDGTGKRKKTRGKPDGKTGKGNQGGPDGKKRRQGPGGPHRKQRRNEAETQTKDDLTSTGQQTNKGKRGRGHQGKDGDEESENQRSWNECDDSMDKKPFCPRPLTSVLKGRDFRIREKFTQYAEENPIGPYCDPNYREPVSCFSKRANKETLCSEDIDEEEGENEEPSLEETVEPGPKPNPEICQRIKTTATAKGTADISQRDFEGDQRVKGKLTATKGNAKSLNIAFLMRYFPKFCEEHHFLSMLLNLKTMTTSRYEGMLNALELQPKLDYFCKTEAERRIGFESFVETLMDPKAHVDYVNFVTDHEIKDWQLLKLPHTENRVVMREGDLIIDTRNTKNHFFIDVFSRGAGDKFVRNGVIIDKLKQRVDIGNEVYGVCPDVVYTKPETCN